MSSPKQSPSVTLYCFTPLVTLITGLIEISLALYTWWRYRSTHLGRLSTALLILLATFQLSEFGICSGGPGNLLTRLGLISTAFMPIIGIHAITVMTRQKLSLVGGYAIASALAIFIAIAPDVAPFASCLGRFVAIPISSPFGVIYLLYYTTGLLMAIGLLIQALRAKTAPHLAIEWLLAGYLAFTVPTALVYILVTTTQESIASILCGFAVILALILTFKVLPLALSKK